MKIRVFSGSFSEAAGFVLAGLDDFCDAVEVSGISTHFFDYAGVPRIAAVVTYREPRRMAHPERDAAGRDGSGKDWREELDAPSKLVFDALRTWRNDLARETGRAAYVLLTNRQLAEIARQRPANLEGVKRIGGIGENRCEELGPSIIKVVQGVAAVSSDSALMQGGSEQEVGTEGQHDE